MNRITNKKGTKEFYANGLGETKPNIRIGGKDETVGKKVVPHARFGFEMGTGKEQYYFKLNKRDFTVNDEKGNFKLCKLHLKRENEEHIWYIAENGDFKWDIDFEKKPETNVFEWELVAKKGVSFEYQRPLEDDIAEAEKAGQDILAGMLKTAVQPEGIAGSYAVYCDKANNIVDEQGNLLVDYKIGKLCHIKKPLCIDAGGKKTWAELKIVEDGIVQLKDNPEDYDIKYKLIITIPQEYLDTCTYPLKLDPTLGYTTAGSSYIAGFDNITWNQNYSTTSTPGGSISSMSIYGHVNGTIKMAVYDGPSAATRLTSSYNVSSTATTWTTTNCSGTISAGGKGCTYFAQSDANKPQIHYDTTGVSGDTYYAFATYANEMLATSGTANNLGAGYRLSLYCTYTEAGGSTSSSVSSSVSSSPSLSPSSSISSSPSSSLSPSSSISSSPSSSLSFSISESISSSASPSSSISSSISPSSSISSSISPSSSVSSSISSSPSPGYTNYTKGNYAVLPTNDNDLEDSYTEQQVTDVATSNDVYVAQQGTAEYLIHQFKAYVGSETVATITAHFRASQAPSEQTVYMQVYNQNSNEWETIDSDSVGDANTKITLTANIASLTNYVNNELVSVRVYQQVV